MPGVQADIDRWNAGNNSEYVTTVRVNLVKIAWDVLTENNGINNHVNRVVFAEKVVNGLNVIASKVALILTAKDIAAVDIETTLAAQWDNITGLL